jgi:hypothetical protein
MSKRKTAAASKRAGSKRKPATASKRVGAPKVTARAQRKTQEFVRSPKASRLRAGSTESPVETRDSKQTPDVDNRAGAAALQAMLKAALQNDFNQNIRNNNPQQRFDFSSLIANVQAYQAKLLEVTQANMHFAFEFSQRLATTRSPFELLGVITEFTGRLILMLQKHSKELAAFWRADSFREIAALPTPNVG